VPEFPNENKDTAIIYIDGGRSADPASPPGKKWVNPDFLSPICVTQGLVTVDLTAVPNEHITFLADPIKKSRTEDGVIAYTWRRFLGGGVSAEWLLRYPMTRAVVRAMDTIETLSQTWHVPAVKSFIVGGASKRGWTTWTTAIVDERVIAAFPIVAPIGNLVGSINRHFEMYGGWSFALEPYNTPEMRLMDYLNTPQFAQMLKLIGIDDAMERLGQIPRYVIDATGDEFFIPDSPRYFWDKMITSPQNPALLLMEPNSEHSQAGPAQVSDILCITAFVECVTNKWPLPEYSWHIDDADGTITVNVTGALKPVKAVAYRSFNVHGDDFRLITCNPSESGGGFNASCINPALWFARDLEPVTEGIYVHKEDLPIAGYVAFMILLEFNVGGISKYYPMRVTSAVSILPIKPPHAPCGEACNKVPTPFPPTTSAAAGAAAAAITDGHQDQGKKFAAPARKVLAGQLAQQPADDTEVVTVRSTRRR
jgi:predicted esterase YcpF (UPF0227 family)